MKQEFDFDLDAKRFFPLFFSFLQYYIGMDIVDKLGKNHVWYK